MTKRGQVMTGKDSTTAYYLPEPSYDARLTEVGKGTPMGELMRRYWQPVGLAEYATDLPRKVRVLGEDLILFRDKSGRAGLLYPRCCHRGTSLFYGAVTDFGIRCCYHGWMFDVEGRVVQRPAEPNPGPINTFRQPWYPVEERYGLIWAYLGPMDKKPLLPRYNVLEELEEGEQLWTDDNNIGAGSDVEATPEEAKVVPFNWLQHFENIHDPAHFYWLHYLHSGPQFGERFGDIDLEAMRAGLPKLMKLHHTEVNERGVARRRDEQLPDGRTLTSIIETVLPAVRVVPNPFGTAGRVDHLGFMLPVDDTHFRIFTVFRGKTRGLLDMFDKVRTQRSNRTVEDTQRKPNDYEAQSSQGPITYHSEEHLGSTDKPIVILRRLFEQQLKIVEQGGDPIGVHFEPGEEYVRLEAGSFLSPEPAPELEPAS